MDSPSVRPSKSMYWTLALMSRVTVTAIHLVGTSDTSGGKVITCSCGSMLLLVWPHICECSVESAETPEKVDIMILGFCNNSIYNKEYMVKVMTFDCVETTRHNSKQFN